MKHINIGGVPEHFNLAWYLTLKNGDYKKEGINLRWHDYPGGTGVMCQALRDKEIDMAVILTEGIIKDIVAGNKSKIVQTFVQSPLVWGIHVASQSPYKTVSDLKGTKAAISRWGSGSHLMAYINAKNNHWNLSNDLDFEIIKDLQGAVTGLTQGDADYFLWETFTTKPLVDNGTFRNIGSCPTPWPCFVIAVREDVLEHHEDEIRSILNIINHKTSEFKTIPHIVETLAKRYQQKQEDVAAWLDITEWSQEVIDESTLLKTQKVLHDLNIIPKIVDYSSLVYKVPSK